MFRIVAASLSAALLAAGSLPAAAQQRSKGPALRASAPSTFTPKRIATPRHVQAPRRYRSFNPPAPLGQPNGLPRAHSRGLAPPSPTGKTAPYYIGPQAPTGIGQGPVGSQNLASRFDSVPPSLPVPMPGQSTPTAAPATPEPPSPPAEQGELQAPIPESAVAASDPATTTTPAPSDGVQVVRHVHEIRVVYVPAPKVQKVVKRKRVYVAEPVYVPRRVYRPRFVYAGPRIHFGIGFGRGFRRW